MRATTGSRDNFGDIQLNPSSPAGFLRDLLKVNFSVPKLIERYQNTFAGSVGNQLWHHHNQIIVGVLPDNQEHAYESAQQLWQSNCGALMAACNTLMASPTCGYNLKAYLINLSNFLADDNRAHLYVLPCKRGETLRSKELNA